MRNGKRSKKRFLYYVSYAVMGPILKLMTKVNSKIELAPGFRKFFWYGGITYQNWRIMMADLQIKDKLTHDLVLYMPSSLIFIMLGVIIGLL